MANVRLRIAGLYFNEIVSMEGDGPFSVEQVMDQYRAQSEGDASAPKLVYVPATDTTGIGSAGTMSSISVDHPDAGDGFLSYKFYDFTAPDTFSLSANSDGTTLDVKRRQAGPYEIQEEAILDGTVVLAWQYYVQADNGEGINRSKTLPQEGFTKFGDAQIVMAGDLVTWRSVGIRLSPNQPATGMS